jgi:transposase
MSDTELLLKSEPVRRLEVFTGSGRRRRWTAEQKARIVAESYAGSEPVSAVARRHGLTSQQLFGWRRHARRGAEAAAGAAGVAFAPVIVERAQSYRSAARPAATDAAAIEIVIGTSIVRVPLGNDITTLHAVLHAVKAVS